MDAKDQENILIKYYRVVDDDNFAAALDLFDDRIHYVRGTKTVIDGKNEMSNFYKKDRQIASGAHKDFIFQSQPLQTEVNGHFSGQLKTGERVEIDFRDIFIFNEDEKIIKRTTTFLSGGREI